MTYPEFLTKPTRPPPLVTRDGIFNTLYAFAGLSTALYGVSKFIVAPWNDKYGTFPDGKKYALSHWSAQTDAQGAVQSQSGHRMLCGSLSGEAVKSFVTQFPRTDAPEPNGA